MTEPQVWTLIAVFSAALFGMLTMMSTMFVRIIRTEIGGLRNQMSAEVGGLRHEMVAEVNGLRHEMVAEVGGLRKEMAAELRGINTRLDGLDRDVQALFKRTFNLE